MGAFMLRELSNRVKKAGQPPGTPFYTGKENLTPPQISGIFYSKHDFHETTGSQLADCLPKQTEAGLTWLNINGLHDITLIEEIAKQYNLHPLTVEDILNVEQRAKMEEFDDYIFLTLKTLSWHEKKKKFSIAQLSLVIGKNFVLSFQEHSSTLFDNVCTRLRAGPKQRLREKGSDYLAYRLIDAVIDQYFVTLEGLGYQIENLEERVISNPTTENSRALYQLKHKMLLLRKAIWPMREVISHLLQADTFITSFTHLYMRDVYDHMMQAIDTIETFRDMLTSILDVYLSSLTNRMNEVMKVLTIIATIFIPVTFVASIYGMNFKYMPELEWRWGYLCTWGIMLTIALVMLFYFRRKKWI